MMQQGVINVAQKKNRMNIVTPHLVVTELLLPSWVNRMINAIKILICLIKEWNTKISIKLLLL